MPDTVTIPGLGITPLHQPQSWAARVALTGAYSYHNDHRLGFVYAAAIGMCCPSLNLPVFNHASGDIIAYGTIIIDHLVGRLHVPPGQALWKVGEQVVTFVADSLPTAVEVREATDFSTPRREEQNS
jgi:hypothetical protein